MAGDWIKMRVDLYDDPSVVGISQATELSEDAVIGKLHRLWSWADRHTSDGKAPGINDKWVDRYVGQSGFATAMVNAGWLAFTAQGIEFPGFDRHNGKSAKQRCDNAVRQRLSRKNRDDGVTGVTRAPIPTSFIRAVYERDAYTCVYCNASSNESRELNGSPKKRQLAIDHITPATRGGRSAMDNLVTACKQCNSEKSDRTPQEWGLEPTFFQDGVNYSDGRISVTEMSRKNSDKGVTREEKRRDKEQPPRFALPDWVPPQAWKDFEEVRKKKRNPLTDRARQLAVAELQRLRDEGNDPRAVIERAVLKGWLSFYPLDAKPTPQFAGGID